MNEIRKRIFLGFIEIGRFENPSVDIVTLGSGIPKFIYHILRKSECLSHF
jgi:hypothetical protein